MSPPAGDPKPPARWLAAGGWLLALVIGGALIRAAVLNPTAAPAPVAAPVAPPPTLQIPADAVRQPTGTLIEWKEAATLGPTAYASGDLLVTMTAQTVPEGKAPVLEVQAAKGAAASARGETSYAGAEAQLAVGRFDLASPFNQVLFVTFGACPHGCGRVRVLDFLDGTWRTVEVGDLDDKAFTAFPKDLDGDGRPELILEDLRFNGVFAPYAMSATPTRLKQIDHGRIVDVSAAPAYRAASEAYLTALQASCEAHNNGACPAFVATAARLGKTDWAWQIMLNAYDPNAQWTLPTACRISATTAPCPDDQQVQMDAYPEAVRWFLGDLGYLPAVYMPSGDKSAPSFDCAKVKAQTLKLVCATPELVAADRQLADAYWRALARSHDPAALEDDERAFIQVRNTAPPDVFTLLRLYQARIEALAAEAAR